MQILTTNQAIDVIINGLGNGDFEICGPIVGSRRTSSEAQLDDETVTLKSIDSWVNETSQTSEVRHVNKRTCKA